MGDSIDELMVRLDGAETELSALEGRGAGAMDSVSLGDLETVERRLRNLADRVSSAIRARRYPAHRG